MLWARRAALGVLVLVAARCSSSLDHDGDGIVTVVCMGDSNTRGAFLPASDGWCERLGASLPAGGWRTVNRGRNGATACAGETSYGGAVDVAGTSLEDALAADHADVAILAFGTNDAVAGCTPDETLHATHRLVARIEATGARAMVALVPPIYAPAEAAKVHRWNAQLARLNDALRLTFRGRTVDFSADAVSSDYTDDGLHLNAEAQRKRADAAKMALLALAGR